jgi:hypothetical protein
MHAYHDDLVCFLRHRWSSVLPDLDQYPGTIAISLPLSPFLEELLSICYQASMLREEERLVSVRLVLAGPEMFLSRDDPPWGLHRQLFSHPRPCNESELRKLSPAVDFSRSLIGVSLNDENEWRIWGMVHSGTRWLQAYRGGRQVPPSFPAVPVILVKSPGCLVALKGLETLATLNKGCIITPDLDVFQAQWLGDYFAEIRKELLTRLAGSNGGSRQGDTLLDPNLVRIIGRQILMRIISAMRESRQGGTILFLPNHRLEELTGPNPLLNIKYQFKEEATRQRLLNLIFQTFKTLTKVCRRATNAGQRLGWQEYINSDSGILAMLDEAIFEAAHQLADFAAVDGAVVLTNRIRMLGFGAMIKGDFDQVKTLARALDLEGEQRQAERTEDVGTRHRAVYYLCHQIPETLGVVISQDGNVRFIKWKDGQVTYWEQTDSFPLQIS